MGGSRRGGARGCGQRMTPALLREAGEFLHGERWRLPLADQLGKDQKTIGRWERGEFPVPVEGRDKIRALVKAKRASGAELLAKLR